MSSRHKNVIWQVNTNSNGTVPVDHVNLAVLMDIRDELQTLTRILSCQNFLGIPAILKNIDKNTKPRPKRRKVKS